MAGLQGRGGHDWAQGRVRESNWGGGKSGSAVTVPHFVGLWFLSHSWPSRVAKKSIQM